MQMPRPPLPHPEGGARAEPEPSPQRPRGKWQGLQRWSGFVGQVRPLATAAWLPGPSPTVLSSQRALPGVTAPTLPQGSGQAPQAWADHPLPSLTLRPASHGPHPRHTLLAWVHIRHPSVPHG